MKGICPVCQQAHPLSPTSPGNHLEVHFCMGEQCDGSGHVAQAIIEDQTKEPKPIRVKTNYMDEPLRRVLIDSEGTAVTPARAEAEYGIVPDTIFIRDDKWTLGCIKNHEPIAAKMWEKNWVAVLINVGKDDMTLIPFTQFSPTRGNGKPVD